VASTPESKVKREIKKVLDQVSPFVYYHMPVQMGMGVPTLDFVGCCCGCFFAIEAKAPGEKPTPRQRLTIATMAASGAAIFIIDGNTSELKKWLATTMKKHLQLKKSPP
jgi:hypothetical protein